MRSPLKNFSIYWNIEVDGKFTVLPVPINIEAEGQIEQLSVELEVQASGPWSANYIDSHGLVKLSESQQELCSLTLGQNIWQDRPESIEELAKMLKRVDSPQHLRDFNECEF